MTISRAPRRLPEFIKRAFVEANTFHFDANAMVHSINPPVRRMAQIVQRTGKRHYSMWRGVLVEMSK